MCSCSRRSSAARYLCRVCRPLISTTSILAQPHAGAPVKSPSWEESAAAPRRRSQQIFHRPPQQSSRCTNARRRTATKLFWNQSRKRGKSFDYPSVFSFSPLSCLAQSDLVMSRLPSIKIRRRVIPSWGSETRSSLLNAKSFVVSAESWPIPFL